MAQIPTIPNANQPVVQPETLVITPPWQRALAQLFAAIPLSGMLVAYVGATAPVGWTQDVTVGLPVLPAGMIWIRKD